MPPNAPEQQEGKEAFAKQIEKSLDARIRELQAIDKQKGEILQNLKSAIIEKIVMPKLDDNGQVTGSKLDDLRLDEAEMGQVFDLLQKDPRVKDLLEKSGLVTVEDFMVFIGMREIASDRIGMQNGPASLKEDANIYGSNGKIMGLIYRNEKVQITDATPKTINGEPHLLVTAIHDLGRYRPKYAGQTKNYTGYIPIRCFQGNLKQPEPSPPAPEPAPPAPEPSPPAPEPAPKPATPAPAFPGEPAPAAPSKPAPTSLPPTAAPAPTTAAPAATLKAGPPAATEVLAKQEQIKSYYKLAYGDVCYDYEKAAQEAGFKDRQEADKYLSALTGTKYGPDLSSGDSIKTPDGQEATYYKTAREALDAIQKSTDYQSRDMQILYYSAHAYAQESGQVLNLNGILTWPIVAAALVRAKVYSLKTGESKLDATSGVTFERTVDGIYFNTQTHDNTWGRLDSGNAFFVKHKDKFISAKRIEEYGPTKTPALIADTPGGKMIFDRIGTYLRTEQD